MSAGTAALGTRVSSPPISKPTPKKFIMENRVVKFMAKTETLPPVVSEVPAGRAQPVHASAFGLGNTTHHKESDKLNISQTRRALLVPAAADSMISHLRDQKSTFSF